MIPDVIKTRPCKSCGCDTAQKLGPSTEGASWTCNSCNSEVQGYSHLEMMEIMSEKVFGLSKNSKEIEIPEGLKVFLVHHGEGADEMEATSHSVKAHVAIAGELPKVGKPLFAKPPGAHPMMAIPYAEVVRVEGAD